MRVLLLLAAVCAVAAVPRQDDVDRYLRAGDAAAARGEWALAVSWYERAESITLEPGRVAYNLATARYHLAKAGHLRELAAAESGYRSCLTDEKRRAKALYGLGNCLLLRAGVGGTLDAAMLRAAADRFLECRQADPELATNARFNEQRARLLLLQAVRRGEAGEEPRGNDDEKEDPPESKDHKRPGKGEGPGGHEAARMKDAGEGPTIEPKDGKARAGKGQMTPVPSSSEAPIDATEAGQQVNEAARRIVEEWRAHRRQRVKPREGARDW